MKKQTCVINIMLRPDTYGQIDYHKRNNTDIKKSVVRFILGLIDAGYYHYQVYIDSRSSFWIAEMLYFLSLNRGSPSITYSLWLWKENVCPVETSTEDEYFYTDVIRHAKMLYWINNSWYDYSYYANEFTLYQAPFVAWDAHDVRDALREMDEAGRKITPDD